MVNDWFFKVFMYFNNVIIYIKNLLVFVSKIFVKRSVIINFFIIVCLIVLFSNFFVFWFYLVILFC